ncbi:leucine zipper putative tumor suppressor 2 homolog [Chrysoperla carnea]|uniref:leucine zipper putative tumor suppressor 2 homolog n=1 Tax=Chrysoperla carnea TaxID=189513 RepID=UPI001D082131|nr:leucine zipper putative tumor suppressor 2 homolog [Chrysoperla carnea]XP_044735691.1 leucine zipper putative tumor suppressor 2 homolog [Chrysoperla carnea]XP_044735692.1 leucine zipper putative tumor suppressor 2 homolog [Chrysoperla carnea]XP_044735693.1 leucine zipper putative tumor suppressor 2 homolog [Chrysoperla carnea]XP_044735694.1 leucine zipper putative tumor suppressor 2 homolog [Chrysoperla carnea]
MGTVDSGNETLFSDDSSCDILDTSSGSACSSGEPSTAADPDATNSDQENSAAIVAPPKIQSCSGVLGKGKVVIRPIAFKPIGMTPAARFGNAGERYGSTPILPRAGSHLTFYGSSNDLRLQRNSNYSLDRKLISSCTSTSSSPPLGMASLSSLPLSSGRKINYDSLESVRKSPTSTLNSHSNRNKSSSTYGLLTSVGGCSMIDLTPSPSDSGVSELEAALRDRDSELAYLRQTMEHNEQVIFRVYQEKERVWERELRRMKTVHENRLRASAQKAHKLEQMLMMQTYQLQQEKKRLTTENDRVCREATELHQEIDLLRSRLEETEWGLCQKTGEISLLKSQLKEAQNDNTTRGHELLQLRGEFRDVRENLDRREDDMTLLRQNSQQKEKKIRQLEQEVKKLKEQLQNKENSNHQRQELYSTENKRLRDEVRELREELSEVAMSEYEGIEDGRSLRGLHSLSSFDSDVTDKQSNNNKLEVDCLIQDDLLNVCQNIQHQCPSVLKLIDEMNKKMKEFEQERITWIEEKEKVLKYQRQLQLNYVQMFRRSRALETEVESLTLELELITKNKQLSTVERGHAVEL